MGQSGNGRGGFLKQCDGQGPLNQARPSCCLAHGPYAVLYTPSHAGDGEELRSPLEDHAAPTQPAISLLLFKCNRYIRANVLVVKASFISLLFDDIFNNMWHFILAQNAAMHLKKIKNDNT